MTAASHPARDTRPLSPAVDSWAKSERHNSVACIDLRDSVQRNLKIFNGGHYRGSEDGRLKGSHGTLPRIVLGEVPVMAGPGGEIAAGAGGRGHLRASHGDREQVIGTLKAAFVQGMLAKDEFDLRVGQTLAARTYADLAALTADLPAGLAAAKPPQPARAQGEQKVMRPGPVIVAATAAYAGAWAYGLFLAPQGGGDPSLAPLIVGGFLVYLSILIASVGAIIVNWRDKRSGGQSPRRAAPGAGGQGSRRLRSAGPGGELPPTGPGHQQTAQAAPTHRPCPLLPGWRPQATTGYLTHPA